VLEPWELSAGEVQYDRELGVLLLGGGGEATVMPIGVSVPLNRKHLRIVRTHGDSRNIYSANRRILVCFFASSFPNYSIFTDFPGNHPSNVNRHFDIDLEMRKFQENFIFTFPKILLQHSCKSSDRFTLH